jgi:hypothetical protein
MTKDNLCVALILVIAIIYFLESCESFTVSTDSSINKFDNTTGQSVVGNVNESSSGINPIQQKNSNQGAVGGDFTFGSSFPLNNNPNDMTKTGQQSVDPNIVEYYSKQMQNDMQQKAFNVNDFLPKEINENWFQTDLSKATKEIDMNNLIEVNKYCASIDTIGSSLKNASRDIRGNIPAPKLSVSPWLNSSYDADVSIKSWC